MKKTIIYVLSMFLILGFSIVKASEYAVFSHGFIKNFKDCDKFEETTNSTYNGDSFTEKSEILGWENGFCHYRTTIVSKDTGYRLECMFSDIQVEELYNAMRDKSRTVSEYKMDLFKPVDSNDGEITYKKAADTIIKGNKGYIAWTKYQNNPYFCRPYKL